MGSFIICIKELMDILGYGRVKATACAVDIRNHVGKDTEIPLTVFDLCEYFKIEIENYYTWLKLQKKK